VDSGNRSYANNFASLLGSESDIISFPSIQPADVASQYYYQKHFLNRLKCQASLRSNVRLAMKRRQRILFHSISPALFSYGSWDGKKTCIIIDWTRALYPRALGHPIKKNIAWLLHRRVLQSCHQVLCMTEAARQSVILDYGIPESRAVKVPAPFDICMFSMKPRPTPSQPRMLFIGNDFERKGGDIILQAIKNRRFSEESVTIITSKKSDEIPDGCYQKPVLFGSPEHKELFRTHDLLILPTRMDSYPQVIGEASAAGLAVVTTKFALGAPEVIENGISGIVCDAPEEVVPRALELVGNISALDAMKLAAYQRMHEKFAPDNIRKAYLENPWN